ncbi:MAG: hypothetical protein M1836_002193 [Candelina mexicana]|nr:MAG: hypothetical protein M1836_002193 [Candelina mexicana]
MFATMQHHASHEYLPSEAHPLNNRAPSPSTPRSKIRKLRAMASFTKPLDFFHRRRTTNTLTSSSSTKSLQSQPETPAVALQRSTTYQGSLNSASDKDSYPPSILSASSSVGSFGRFRTDDENTPHKAPRPNDTLQETPKGAPKQRRLTTLEQQRWTDPNTQSTPTKTSRLDNCPLRKAIKEARTPIEHQGSSRITGTQRHRIPLKTPQLATPKRAPVAKSHTTFEHQRYFTDPTQKGFSSIPRRDSYVHIEHRHLLQPLPPPFPKSQTMGVLMSGSEEFADGPLRSHPSSSGERLMSSFKNRPSVGASRESLASSLHSRPSLGPIRDYTAHDDLHSRPSFVRLRDLLTPIYSGPSLSGSEESLASSLQSRPSLGTSWDNVAPDDLHSKPSFGRLREHSAPILKTRPSIGGIDEYSTPIRRGRPSAGVFEEYKTPKLRARPSIEGEETPRARLVKRSPVDEHRKSSPLAALRVRQIREAMPSAYWCGRFTTLNDRFRNEEFNLELEHHDSETERYALSTDELRVRRVFIHLSSLCQTEEARASLVEFQEKYAIVNETPAAVPVGGSLREKTSFFDKLIGKRDVRKEVEKGTIRSKKP